MYQAPQTARELELECAYRLRSRDIWPCAHETPRCDCPAARRYRRARAGTLAGLASAASGGPSAGGLAAIERDGQHRDGKWRAAVALGYASARARRGRVG